VAFMLSGIYAEWHLWRVTNNPFMLGVIMPNVVMQSVVAPFEQDQFCQKCVCFVSHQKFMKKFSKFIFASKR